MSTVAFVVAAFVAAACSGGSEESAPGDSRSGPSAVGTVAQLVEQAAPPDSAQVSSTVPSTSTAPTGSTPIGQFTALDFAIETELFLDENENVEVIAGGDVTDSFCDLPTSLDVGTTYECLASVAGVGAATVDVVIDAVDSFLIENISVGSDTPSSVPGAGPDGTVTVFGNEFSDDRIDAVQTALDEFGNANGITIEYESSRDFTFEIDVRVAGGNAPDIALHPGATGTLELIASGDVVALPDEVRDAVRSSWPAAVSDLYTVDGVQSGVQVSMATRSLVWYQPDAFAANGYAVPSTYAEFEALISAAASDGNTPLCVGIESGLATGWVFTDWTEDLILRQHGPAVYEQWVAHEIPFDDERIVASMQTVLDLWADPNVFAASGTIATTPFQDNAEPLVDGECLMHRQGDFFETFFPPEVTFMGSDPGSVHVFYLPSDEGRPMLVDGVTALAFTDRPEVWQVMQHLASSDYADSLRRALDAAGGEVFRGVSLAEGQDLSLSSPLEQRLFEILSTSGTYHLDASDRMPIEVGAGSFWEIGTEIVNGDLTAADGAEQIEATWPT